MTDVRKQTVEAGYDALAEDFLEWSARIEGDPRDRFLSAFTGRLPEGALVLDLGCGPGVPSTLRLAERFQVVGVDISGVQLRLARQYVPNARFIRADVTEVAFAEGAIAGITAFYSIAHIPREEHGELFGRFAAWLEPGGLLLAALGVDDNPDFIGEWLGVPMFFSGHDVNTNRVLLRAAAFELLLDEVVAMREPDYGPVSFLWVLARKPA